MKKIIMDYCLLLQIVKFVPKISWFSCMGKKVPFWQFFRIFKNCQNGTFLPMHENQKILGQMYLFNVVNNGPLWLFQQTLDIGK